MERSGNNPRNQPTDHNNSITTNVPVYPPGSRFLPQDLSLVRLLRNMVEKNETGFITALDVYKDEPWLLNHVQNDLFKRNEWYYFSPRTKRGGHTTNRTVPGKGESKGGTWRSTSMKKAIKDPKDKIEGYKQNLVYNKKVKREIQKTGWLMTEYCLNKDIHDDLVLCYIRDTCKKKIKEGFVEKLSEVENNILSKQVQDEQAGLIDFATRVETMMLHGGQGDDTHQQQQQEKDTSILSCLRDGGQDSATMMTTNNDNNFMTMSHHQNQLDDFGFGFAGAEDVMIDIDELINVEGDVTQRH